MTSKSSKSYFNIATSQLFIQAVTNWLSKFPDSPILPNSSYVSLRVPQTLYRLFKTILYDEDFIVEGVVEIKTLEKTFMMDCDPIHNHNSDTIPHEFLRQISYLDLLLHNHTRHYSIKTMNLKLYNPDDVPNMFKLILVKDLSESTKLCHVLVKICSQLHAASAKLAMEQLTDIDRELVEYCIVERKMRENEYQGVLQLQNTRNLQVQEAQLTKVQISQALQFQSQQFQALQYDRCQVDQTPGLNSSESPFEEADVVFMKSVLWENQIFERLIRSMVKNN